MNKLFNKIAAGVVGLAMAIGVGVAIGSGAKATKKVGATEYSDAVLAKGSNAYDNNTINGKSTIKCGTSSKQGSMTITLPNASGTTTLSFHIVAWSGDQKSVNLSVTSGVSLSSSTLAISDDSGLSGSGTSFTLNGSEGDYLKSVTLTNAVANTVLTITAKQASKSRFFVWDASYETVSSSLTNRQITFEHNSQTVSSATVELGLSSNTTYSISNVSETGCSIASSNTGVATVSGSTITAASNGTTTVTISKADDSTYHYLPATITVNVSAAEPSMITGQDLSDLFADASGNGKQLYEVTGVVSAWKTGADGTAYGNFYLQEEGDTSTSYYIYGATADSTKLVWNGTQAKYVFTNPQDFLTNPTTSGIEIGDILTMQLTRCDYQGTPEATGIVTHVEKGTAPVIPEPSMVTGEELSDLFADTSGNGKQLYEVTGVVSAWKTGTDGTKYGNFYLQEEGDTSTSYYIYGATATASALSWDTASGVYVFTNPQDFLTDNLTKDIAIGDVVTMRLTRCDYNSTPEAQGIVVSVAQTPSISVSPATLSLTVGGANGTITPTIENAGSPAPTVVWTTSSASVATVSGGTVSPVGQGTCTITATITVSGTDYSATCTVTVSPAPVVIDASGVYTMVTDDSTLAAGDIVIITRNNGETAMSTTQNGNNRGSVATNISNDEITISGTTTIQAFVLEEYTVGEYATFAFNTGDGYIYAASSGNNYLRTESTLDDNGKFTVSIDSSDGIATITARGENTRNLIQYNTGSSIFACYGSAQSNGAVSIFKKGNAPVDPTKVTGVTLDSNSATIGAGETVTLTATVSPSTALDKSVSWSTSDANVATVANGVVTGVGAGTATITVTTTDGNKTATCEVTVRTISLGFFYQVTDASSLTANDKVVIAAHVGDNIKVMENVSPDTKKMPAASVNSSAKWTDTFGNQTVKSFRHDAGSTLWTVSGDSTGWTFSNGSTELYANASNTNLYTAASGSTLVLSSGTHGTFRLAISGSTRAVAYQVSGNVFGHYATSNIDGSAYYDVEIYKLVENPTVLTGLTCTGTGSYTGDWSSLTTAFGNLTLGEKAYYKHASYTVSGEGTETVVTAADGTNASVAAFVAKYDYIVAKYGTTSNPDFIGRNPSPLNSGRISIFGNDATNSGATLAIIIASILSLTAVGGYFVIRKRKFTK